MEKCIKKRNQILKYEYTAAIGVSWVEVSFGGFWLKLMRTEFDQGNYWMGSTLQPWPSQKNKSAIPNGDEHKVHWNACFDIFGTFKNYLQLPWISEKVILFKIFFDPCEELGPGPIVPRYGFSEEFIWQHAAVDLFDEVFKAGSNQWNGESCEISIALLKVDKWSENVTFFGGYITPDTLYQHLNRQNFHSCEDILQVWEFGSNRPETKSSPFTDQDSAAWCSEEGRIY